MDALARKIEGAIKVIKPNINICKEVDILPLQHSNIPLFTNAYNKLGGVR